MVSFFVSGVIQLLIGALHTLPWFHTLPSADLRQQAQQVVRSWPQRQGVYTQVAPAVVATGLEARIRQPTLIDHGSLGICGPAVLALAWAVLAPHTYAQAVLQLYQGGSFSVNGWRVQANTSTYRQTPPDGLHPIDTLLLSAIRHSENLLLPYDEANDSGMASFSWPAELSRWLAAVGLQARTLPGLDGYDLPSLNRDLMRRGTVVLLLVDWQRFGLGHTRKQSLQQNKAANMGLGTLLGTHYVALTAPILPQPGGRLHTTVWTWGNPTRQVLLPAATLLGSIKGVWVVSH